jgi:hypothetical protein
VQIGHHNPQQNHQSENEERIIEPQPAALIRQHQNACSLERVFGFKSPRRHRCVSVRWHVCALASWRVGAFRVPCSAFRAGALVVAILALLGSACLADPHRLQSVDLFERLVSARGMFMERPPRADEGCTTVGEVQTRLFGEPGLSEERSTWVALRNAAGALQSACGQSAVLAEPSTGTPILTLARERWQRGIQREIGVACDHLREAATALNRPSPC